jgi:hypothetical protein
MFNTSTPITKAPPGMPDMSPQPASSITGVPATLIDGILQPFHP